MSSIPSLFCLKGNDKKFYNIVDSSLGSWASGFSKSSRKSSTSDASTVTKDEKTSKKSFVQSLAKSITFPSPRCPCQKTFFRFSMTVGDSKLEC